MRNKYALLVALLLLWPIGARGGILAYRPRLISSHADLSAEMNYRSDQRQVTSGEGAEESVATNAFRENKIRESLNLKTVSYVYHPDLFHFSLDGSGLLDQIETETNGQPAERKVIAEQYDFRGFILRRKEYHGEVYVNTNKPFVSARGQVDQVEYSQAGIDLDYLKSPYRSLLSLTHHLNQTVESQRVADQAKVSVGYNKDDLSYDFLGEHTVDSAQGVQHTVDNLNLNNRFLYKGVDFNTGLTLVQAEGESQQSQGYTVQEAVGSKLPWNSNWRSTYSRLSETSDTVRLAGVGNSQRLVEDFDLLLNNKLFESLRTLLRNTQRRNQSSQGSAKDNRLTAETHYQKKIRSGSLVGDLTNNIMNLEKQGRVTEVQSFANRGISAKKVGLPSDLPLVIPRGDFDPLLVSVEVEIKSGQFAALTHDIHWYRDQTVPNLTIFITDEVEEIFRLRGVLVPSEYTFRVTYTTIPADYILQTNNTLLHLGVGFFENAWHTDFSHQYTVQDIIAGDPHILALAPAITSDTIALTYMKEPFVFSTAYRLLQADYTGKMWKNTGEFRRQIAVWGPLSSKVKIKGEKVEAWRDSPTGEEILEQETSMGGGVITQLPIPWVAINLSHDLKYEVLRGYVNEFQGYFTSSYLSLPKQDKDVFSSNLNLQTTIPKTKVSVTVRSYYEKENYLLGTLTTRIGYKVATGYKWNFGLTNLSLNADYSNERVDTDNGGVVEMAEQSITDVYLRMSRQLF